MAKFILTRLGQLVLVVIVVTFVPAVVMSFIPGDPVTVIAPFAEGQQRDEIRADLNLDDPVPVRYVKWLGGFATGDLGNYYTVSSNRPVADQFWPAIFLPMTLRPPLAVAQPPGLVRMTARCSAVMPSHPAGCAMGVASGSCAGSLRWSGATSS